MFKEVDIANIVRFIFLCNASICWSSSLRL